MSLYNRIPHGYLHNDETGENSVLTSFSPAESPIHYATMKGDIHELEKVLNNGEDVNMIQSTVAPLYLGCMLGEADIVKTLIKHNCDINATTVELQQTALHCACSKGLEKIASILVQQGAILDQQDAYGATALFLSGQYGYTNIANCLIESGANVNIPDGKGLSPLAIATLNGRVAIANRLIQCNANLNQRDKSGNTPLLHAIKSGQKQICGMLTQAGASVNIANHTGQYPISLASKYGNVGILDYLISHGADINVVSADGTPVFLAVQQQQLNGLKKLISAGADVMTKNDPNHRIPLIEAIHQYKPNYQILIELISSGSPIDLDCECHRIPLHALLSNCNQEAVSCFLQSDCKIGFVPLCKLEEIRECCPCIENMLQKGDQPCSLKGECRKVIKSCIGSVSYGEKINQLTLPQILKGYLLHQNLFLHHL